MRLRRLDLTRYGKFTDASLDFGDHQPGTPDLHIVYGLNEAGKSTAFSAYLDLLYGIPTQSGYGFLHPYGSMQIGALIQDGERSLDLVRLKRNANSLQDSAGKPVNEALIGTLLGGISRKAYATMFSLDDASLREGGMAILESRGDLGELLFSASAGLADISRTLGTIEREADQIYRQRAKSTTLANLKQALAALKEKRGEIDTQASAYAQLAETRAAAERNYAAAEAELGSTRLRQADLGRMLHALPAAQELRRIRPQLEAMRDLPRPPRSLAAELPGLLGQATRLETRAQLLADRISRLQSALADAPVDPKAALLSERMDALGKSRSRFETAEPDLPRRQEELNDIEARLRLALSELGCSDASEPASLLLTAPVTGTLRDLIERKSGIDANLAASAREMRKVQSALEEIVGKKADGHAQAPLSNARALRQLSDVVEQLRRSGFDAALQVGERELASQQQRLSRSAAALVLWKGSIADLARLSLPDRRQIESWRALATEVAKRLAIHRDHIRSLAAGEREAALKLEILADSAVPDDEAARALRAERHALWSLHKQMLDAGSAQAFEAALERDDALSEQRLVRANELADLRQRQQALRLDRAALAEQHALAAEAEAELAALDARVTKAIPAGLHLPDEALEDRLYRLEQFVVGRQDCLALAVQTEEAEQRVSDIRNRIAESLGTIARLLGDAGIAAKPDLNAETLLSLAEDAINSAAARDVAQASLEEREQSLKRDEAARRRDLEEADTANARWDADWAAALAETWFPGEVNIVRVRARLDTLAKLPGLLREKATNLHRIAGMEQDRQSYGEDLTAIYAALGDMEQPSGLAEAYAALKSRLAAATRLTSERAARQSEIDALQADETVLKAEHAEHEAERQRVLQSLGLATLDDSASLLLDRIAERDRLEARKAELETVILADLRVQTMDDAETALAALDADETAQEHLALTDRISQMETRVRDLFGALTLARDRLEAVGGDNAVAALEAERATTLLSMEDSALRYLRLKTGMLAASGALELYRETHRSTMMRRASDAFRQITRGDYTGLAARIEKDREILIGQTREGGSRLADEMSTGTRTQLYLALRLAGYEEFAKVRPPVPFIADDIMETFDEPRSEQVFRLFSEMAGIGQVIYLTHHRHLCDIAKAVLPDVRIHEL